MRQLETAAAEDQRTTPGQGEGINQEGVQE